eukprot:m.239775 g.239775  ORF g.239775 m.239775 type:complete len:577 (+) comp10921_c0_seq11:2196-3926(+)
MAGAPKLSTQIILRLALRNVAKLDVVSKSDPMVVVYLRSFSTGNEFREIGRTEVAVNDHNPNFTTTVPVEYFFEESQELRFAAYDSDVRGGRLDQHDFIGELIVTLGEIVGVHSGHLKRALGHSSGKQRGELIVIAEEKSQNLDVLHMQLAGEHLDKKDLFGKSDPFVKLWKDDGHGGWVLCHTTEVIKKTLDPTWKPMTLSLGELCNGQLELPIKVECFDWDRDGGHDYIGEFQTTVAEMTSRREYELINLKKQAKKKSYKNSGVLRILSFDIEKRYSFLDFIEGGTELNFVVAVDFTASNGNPIEPNSLHYQGPTPNQYVQALSAVGRIIQDYDTDKLFPGIGFGAKLGDQLSHAFPLNGLADDRCYRVEGLLAAYQQCISRVTLWGPTHFAPVIEHASRMAAGVIPGSMYFVLLIITDGVINDMDATRAAIVAAAKLPLSIIIVGVGNADFGGMQYLDGDDHRLTNTRGEAAARDIVQFVPFQEFSGGNGSLLAKEVLAEIPQQVCEYMRLVGVKPKPRAAATFDAPTATGRPPSYAPSMNAQGMPMRQPSATPSAPPALPSAPPPPSTSTYL